jgi:signal transduction histidine kinase
VTRRHRRLWLFLVGVVVAVAVGFGVVAAVARSRLEAREQQARAWRAVDVVHGVVEESLEELRLRESARPFDHYNAVYVPEGVLAASDALAPSPLSRAPDDARLRGWVQLNPDGTVTLPFDATRPELAAQVRGEVGGAAFAPLRALTSPPTGPIVAQVGAPGGGDARTAARSSQSSSLGNGDVGNSQGLLQQLNVASANVYSQLKEAAPEPSKRAAIAQNEPLPKVARTDVDWSDEDLGKLGTKAKAPSKKPSGAAMKKKMAMLEEERAQQQMPQDQVQQEQVQQRVQGPAASTSTSTQPQTSAQAPAPTVAVSYTPMVFDELGGQRVLHRTVTSVADGARTVQVVLLDEAALRAWLDGILARRVDAAIAGRLVGADDASDCAVRAPVSSILDDIVLCVPPGVQTAGVGLEVAVLTALLLLVVMVLVVLDRAAERAEALARQRSAFVSAVSHELRTPLTTLRMYAELLRDGLVADPEKARRFHGDMVQESVRLSHLVENVLEAQRLEEGRRPLRLEEVDVGGLVRSVVDGQRPLLGQRGFAVDVVIDERADLIGAVDRQAIEQTLVNLIENAVKYGRGDDARLEISVARRGDRAVIVVADHGPGVPGHERERLFQRFARLERPGEEHVAGTGLGLALVRELARAHGGDARIVDSAVGCRVEVTLPLRTLAT